MLNSRAVTQRVMHDVKSGPAPQHDANRAARRRRSSRHRHDGAERHVAGRARLAVADQFGAEQRTHAIGARPAPRPRNARPSAVVTATLSPRSSKPVTIASATSSIASLRAAGIEQHVMQIDAVNDDVGIFETRAKRCAGRNPHKLLAVERIQHQNGGRRISDGQDLIHQRPAARTHERRWGRTGCRSRWRRIPAAPSSTRALRPRRAKASAVVSPPSPPPTMRIGIGSRHDAKISTFPRAPACATPIRLISHSRSTPELSLTRRRTVSPSVSMSAARGAAEIDQKIAVHFRDLGVALAQAAAAGGIDELPGFVARRIFERRAAGAAFDRLRRLARTR